MSTHKVDHGDCSLADENTFGVVLDVPHLTDDVEEAGCSSVSKDNDVEGIDGVDKGRVCRCLDVNFERSSLRSGAGSFRYTACDSQSDDGRHNRDDSNPTDPGDLVERLDTGYQEGDDSADNNKDDCAGAVYGDGVHCDRE